MNKMLAEFFLVENVLDENFFVAKSFPRKKFRSINFSLNIFLVENCLVQIFCLQNNFLGNFLDEVFFCSKIFLFEKFFGRKYFIAKSFPRRQFGWKIFCTFFVAKSFAREKCMNEIFEKIFYCYKIISSETFLMKKFFHRKFLSKIF